MIIIFFLLEKREKKKNVSYLFHLFPMHFHKPKVHRIITFQATGIIFEGIIFPFQNHRFLQAQILCQICEENLF